MIHANESRQIKAAVQWAENATLELLYRVHEMLGSMPIG